VVGKSGIALLVVLCVVMLCVVMLCVVMLCVGMAAPARIRLDDDERRRLSEIKAALGNHLARGKMVMGHGFGSAA
jgi:hypothetical protein